MDWYLLFFELQNYADNQCIMFFVRLEKVQTLQMHLECKYQTHMVPPPLVRLDVLSWMLQNLVTSTVKEPGGVYHVRALCVILCHYIWARIGVHFRLLKPKNLSAVSDGHSAATSTSHSEWPFLYLFRINVIEPSLSFLVDLHLSSFSCTMCFS